MEKEEIMNVVNDCLENGEITVLPEVPKKEFDKSKAVKFGVLGLAISVIGAGIGVLVKKNKGKLTDYRVKKLEKKGYVVIAPEQQLEAAEEEFDYLVEEN